MMVGANHSPPPGSDERIALKRGELRKIASWQFSTILFTTNSLIFSEGGRVKTFETLRDRTAVCQTRHGRVSQKVHPARDPYEGAGA
jgi:hypothetical protein